MKSYFKYLALFFGMLIAVISCQDDNLEQTQKEQLVPTIKTVTFENAGPVFNKLKQDLNIAPYLKSKDYMFEMATESSRTTTDTLGVTIYTDVIKEVTLGDYTSYTMLMATPQTSDNKFYNLTIEEKNGESNMFTAEYTPDEQWLNNQSQSFSGDIKIQHWVDSAGLSGGSGGQSGNPNLGPGTGGVGNPYDNQSPYYPTDCDGIVIITIRQITFFCECATPGHLPGQCTDCDRPGYYAYVPYYHCESTGDSNGTTDPGGGNPNNGGVNTGGTTTNPNNPANNDNSVAAIVNPNEDCNMPDEDRAFDEDNDCQLSPKEACKKAGHSDSICDCVGEGGTIAECQEDDCNTSKEDLKKVFPNISDSNAQTLATVINDKGKDFGIDTKEKLQHFLSQAGHEVGGFNNGFGVAESTYYSTKARLLKIFPKYYSETDTINKRKPDSYVANSSGHANYVYCCRMGNGNEASGDGYKYRGRGIFQLTGKTNYTNFKTWYNNKYDPDKDFVTNPELLKDNDTIAILSALWYYKTSVLDKITIDSTTTVKKVTKKVNGGTNGLSDRKEIFTKAKDSIDCN